MSEALLNHCFGCGPENPIGLRLKFVVGMNDVGALTASATLRLSREYEGGAGNLHGGILATLMDEAMSKLSKPLGVVAVTRRLEVEYLRPSPVGAELTLIARHERREGRKLFHTAELMNADGDVLVRGTGLFVAVQNAVEVTAF